MVGPGKWQETLKKVKNEKCTQWDMDYGEKPERSEERRVGKEC